MHLHHARLVVDLDKGDVPSISLDGRPHELEKIVKGLAASLTLGVVDRLAMRARGDSHVDSYRARRGRRHAFGGRSR